MTWLKIDDGFTDNAKIEALSDRAFRLHVAGMCFCARTLSDGVIPEGRVPRLIPKVTKRMVEELVTVGVWLLHPQGYEIKDYLLYNPSREEVERQRAEKAERQRKYRDKQRGAPRDASRDARPPQAPPRPGPKGQGSGTEGPRSVGSSPAADGGDEQFDPEVSLRNAERIKDELARLRAKRSEEAEAS